MLAPGLRPVKGDRRNSCGVTHVGWRGLVTKKAAKRLVGHGLAA